MCSRTSFRFLAASTINSRRSRTFTWPVNSLNIGGLSEISKAASGSGGFISIVAPIWRDARRRGALHVLSNRRKSSFQIFRQHELGPARFQNIIDPIECVFHQVQAEPTRFDHIMGAALHL